MRVERAVIVADPGMITTDDLVRTTVILAKERVQQSFSRVALLDKLGFRWDARDLLSREQWLTAVVPLTPNFLNPNPTRQFGVRVRSRDVRIAVFPRVYCRASCF